MASPRRSVSFRTSRIGTDGLGRRRPCRSFFEDVKPEPAKPSDTSAAADAELAEAQQEEVVHQEINVRAGAPQQPPLSQAAMAAAAAQEATPLPEHIKPEDMAKFYSLLNQPNWDGVQQRVGELVQAEQLDERVLEAALLVLNAAFERKESEAVLNSLQNLIEYLTIIIKRMKQPPELQLMEALMDLDHTQEEQQATIGETLAMAFAKDSLCTKESFLAQMDEWQEQAKAQDAAFAEKRQEALDKGASEDVLKAMDGQFELREQAMARIRYIKQAAVDTVVAEG